MRSFIEQAHLRFRMWSFVEQIRDVYKSINHSSVMWYVYVLKSRKHDWHYVGSTDDVRRRFREHNSGQSPATRPYAPFALAAYVALPTKVKAIALEKYFKTGSGRAILNNRIL